MVENNLTSRLVTALALIKGQNQRRFMIISMGATMMTVVVFIYLGKYPLTLNSYVHHQNSSRTTVSPQLPKRVFNTFARHYTKNISDCWTDEDYNYWKQGDFYPPGPLHGNIAYMILTGDKHLRSRCDIMMCTFGVTIHPSRLFFVGESSSDSRIPIYDVVAPETPRPVDTTWSHQKVSRGLAMVIDKLNKSADGAEVQWIMVLDDDTFISPPNLALLVAEYNPQESFMIGQECAGAFCGGAGYVISRGLFERLPPFIISCYRTPVDGYSDQAVPRCITIKTNVRPLDRKEFNSQPPDHFTSRDGLQVRPQGYGRGITFHYMKPAERYLSLWRLHQAYYRSR
ncbi:unnamed protein product [Adineta steineri]|uniref:N-acetylgalactosaminide beta-1,3-galactosyltransferase n=1 Tax=Adineta steineri TaxID=433720 RepID=A0A818WL18_9BILA|nr:unnamed protein product [Adineta steineri]